MAKTNNNFNKNVNNKKKKNTNVNSKKNQRTNIKGKNTSQNNKKKNYNRNNKNNRNNKKVKNIEKNVNSVVEDFVLDNNLNSEEIVVKDKYVEKLDLIDENDLELEESVEEESNLDDLVEEDVVIDNNYDVVDSNDEVVNVSRFEFVDSMDEDIDEDIEIDEDVTNDLEVTLEDDSELLGKITNDEEEKFKFTTTFDEEFKEAITKDDNDLTDEVYNQYVEENEDVEEAISDVEGVEEVMVDNNFPVSSTLNESLSMKETLEKNNNIFRNKFYLSFEVRVILMLISILLLFLVACGFVFESISSSGNRVLHYDETSTIDYKVCVQQNEYYKESCLDKDMKYLSSITENIPTTFNYDVVLSSPVSYNLHYRVVGVVKVVDKKDQNKVLYTTEDVLVPSTLIKDKSDHITFSTNVDIPYKNYNDFITSYKQRYSLDAVAYLDIVLYLDEDVTERPIASMNIPLGVNSYSITENVTANEQKTVKLNEQEWNHYSIICATIGMVSILFSLILVIKLTSLVSKVLGNKNLYQRKLTQILREYDNIIVIAKDGYEVNKDKQIIKVDCFKEIVDARNTLEKPIIFVKVNDVKCEFYVEDLESIYLYTMKEADIEGK